MHDLITLYRMVDNKVILNDYFDMLSLMFKEMMSLCRTCIVRLEMSDFQMAIIE